MAMNRTLYVGVTPDRSTYIPLSPQAFYMPAPTTANIDATFPKWNHRVNRIGRRAAEVVQSNIGLLLVASSQLFFSLMNVGVKMLNSLDPPVPAVEVILVRMGITWLCCVLYMYIMKVPDPLLGPKGVRLFLAQRGFFGFLGIFGLYYSLQYLSLSDATVLQFLSPMFTAIAGAVFLHETLSRREALAGLVSLIGVILIARPQFLFGKMPDEVPVPPDVEDMARRAAGEIGTGRIVVPAERLTAVGVALLGAVGAAGAYTTIRHIGKRAHALHNLVAYSALCVIVTTITMIALRIPVVVPMRWDWLLMLFMIGIFGFGGQVLLTMGLQRETAGRGTIAVYGQIVFATTFERVFFHTSPSSLSITGTVIIIGSALYVALTKKTQSDTEPKVVPSDDPSVEDGLLADHTAQDDNGIDIGTTTIVLSENPCSKGSKAKVPDE